MLIDQGIEIPEALKSEALTIELMAERVRYNLRIKASDVARFKKFSGLKLPAKIGGTSKLGDQVICKFGPDEWVISDNLAVAGKLTKKMAKLSGQFVMSTMDISHRNVGFIITGSKAVEAVNVGCPLDLSMEAFPVGKAIRTIFENASIQLCRYGENEFEIECWRSFAPYLVGFMKRFATDLAA